MNLHKDAAARIEYIQKLFVSVGRFVETMNSLNNLLVFLDQQPLEFRSIVYESASAELGLRDLNSNGNLDQWREFRKNCLQHSFHIDIGLGWSFAKKGMFPGRLPQMKNPITRWMVFDGMGYYYALFKGRSTLKNKSLPDGIEFGDIYSFNQGLGRRLWYMAKGNVNEVYHLIQSFPEDRRPDLFRGVGIACSYVGGNRESELLSLLKLSGNYSKQLQTGILLGAISRVASNTINEDADRACRIICNKAISEIKMMETFSKTNFFYLYKVDESN